MKHVIIIQRILPHYRVRFFRLLYDALQKCDIRMTLIYGQHGENTVPTTTQIDDEWAVFVKNIYISIAGTDLVWQNIPSSVSGADLVIVEQANRLLANYMIYFRRLLGQFGLAYWGHGMNYQAEQPGDVREKFKRYMLTKADWWFAYTSKSANHVMQAGYPGQKLTVLNNSIDTLSFRKQINQVTATDIKDVREKHGIEGKNVCLYCGGLYADKKIGFLLDSALQIREQVSDFELVVIGDGPDASLVRDWAASYNWIHYVGAKFGEDRAVYYCLSRLLLMPGLVGLAILDSFVAKRPIVTTDIKIHSPEIAYLDNGVNGVMCRHDTRVFADTVISCLSNTVAYGVLQRGCEASSVLYTLEKMVDNFTAGVQAYFKGGKRKCE